MFRDLHNDDRFPFRTALICIVVFWGAIGLLIRYWWIG